MDIKEKKTLRFQFLKTIYDKTEEGYTRLDGEDIGRELNIKKDEASKIIQYLIDENLLEGMGSGLGVVITHYGILEVEEALSHPDKPTEHFPPINIISIGTMNNSVIQQGSPGGSQHIENKIKQSNPDLKEFLVSLKDNIQKLNLSFDAQNEMLAEILTAEAQSNSPKPKISILNESLKTIRNLLEGVASEAMAPVFIEKVNLLLSAFS